MTRRAGPVAVAAAVAVATAVLTGGCGFHGVYSLPLPGAPGGGAHTYQVHLQFSDVLDLVPDSDCMVNAAPVGHITSIAVQGDHALVTCLLPDSVHLPANCVAQISETSLLGEKFVELSPPPAGVEPVGRLAAGALVPLSRTSPDATVEEVLGALSGLLNGGGVGQLHEIAVEVNRALAGRGPVARDLLARLAELATNLSGQRHQIVDAISGLDHLAAVVRAQEGDVVQALHAIPPALGVLAANRAKLVTMLGALSNLSTVAVRVVDGSQSALLANLRALQPTLTRLAQVGTEIPKTLGVLITYPTADSVEQEYFGDYGNLSLSIDLSAASLLAAFGPAKPPLPAPVQPAKPPAQPPPVGRLPQLEDPHAGIGALLLGELQ